MRTDATMHQPKTARKAMESDLSLEFLRVVEQAAIACAHTMGQGDRHLSDKAAVEAMRKEMDTVPIDGTIVIGEGERDEAPMLYIGERVGMALHPNGSSRQFDEVDIAVDPLEGHESVCDRRTQRHRRARGIRARRSAARARRLHGQAGRRPERQAHGRSRCAGARQPAGHRAQPGPSGRRAAAWSCSIGRATRN